VLPDNQVNSFETQAEDGQRSGIRSQRTTVSDPRKAN
jgi:hypothetical protein